MDRSAYALLSENEFVELAARIQAGKYNNQKGFYHDLANFLRVGGDFAQVNRKNSTGDIYFYPQHHLIQAIESWESFKGISGLRQAALH
ncbi:hypothetical protein LU196_18200 [Pantoea sp. Mb-10]|uniref:hypothetical protein n=1 Tax=unclassified Pantoea TaxID=2630326 RepID=UPI001E57B864|nr:MULTISPECIES: hypothetical protein [unclassified Pantoea]MCE0491969.1 hypothetical protein [Pantoea sp. Mb-10]MCE0503526.1 hypothetical protein [Pantoea sp. Pb-8]